MSATGKSAKFVSPQGGRQIDRLLDIMAHLRTHPEGCAWTKEQTHASLTPYLVEESYETAEMIDHGNVDDALRDELGDVLLQIVFHAEIARERGSFAFEDIAKAIADKLERRYPTILGDEPNTLKTAEEIDRRWEEIKAEERKRKGIVKNASILDEVSHGMPALVRAAKLKGRAAKAGWEWPNTDMLIDKIAEEARELKDEIENPVRDMDRIRDEFGDLMFLMVDFARYFGFDAEDALRRTNSRFERRFRHMEQYLKQQGYAEIKDAPRNVRMAGWNDAKATEKKQG